jgi:hypothetical protein
MKGERPMTNDEALHAWYEYAARTPGFIGEALRTQRAKAFLFQKQQRAMLGILGEQYNDLWLRLQAMRLPRPDQFTADLARIVRKVESNTKTAEGTLDLECLEELIRAGLA